MVIIFDLRITHVVIWRVHIFPSKIAVDVMQGRVKEHHHAPIYGETELSLRL